jgi:hypothetical protein
MLNQTPTSLIQKLTANWRAWWRKQTPNRQDRFAFMAPLAAVVLFMAAITTAFWYLRYEEIEREQEVVRRDVEYAQQRLRVRLLDKQEQIMRMARDIASRETNNKTFLAEAQTLLNQSPELASLTWLDPHLKVLTTYISTSNNSTMSLNVGSAITQDETRNTFQLARDLLQPIYSPPIVEKRPNAAPYTQLQLHVPIVNHGKFEGVLLAEYTMDGMLRYAVPSEIANRYAVSLRDVNNQVLAGQANKAKPKVTEVLPMLFQTNEK